MATNSYVYTYEKAAFILEQYYDEVINESDPPATFAMDQVFNVGEFKRTVFVSYNVAGPGLPEEREFLETLAGVNYTEGDPVTYRPIKYGAQMAIPTELVRWFAKFGADDPDVAAKVASWADFMRAMKYNGKRKMNLEALDILLNGTSTDARHVGRNGEPLFSTNHASLSNPAVSGSNLAVNLPFTETNVNFVINALSYQKDENGAPIDSGDGWIILTGPALETKGWTMLNTEGKVGSADNDKNYVYSRRSKIMHVVEPEIDADYLGWFVFNKKNGLFIKWMDRPYFEKEPTGKNNSIGYFMNMSGRAGWTKWRGTFASLPS